MGGQLRPVGDQQQPVGGWWLGSQGPGCLPWGLWAEIYVSAENPQGDLKCELTILMGCAHFPLDSGGLAAGPPEASAHEHGAAAPGKTGSALSYHTDSAM